MYATEELEDYGYSYSDLTRYPYFLSSPNAYRLDPVTSTDFGIN